MNEICDCECHEPGVNIMHFTACCWGPCPWCQQPLRFETQKAHVEACKAKKFEGLTEKEQRKLVKTMRKHGVWGV